MAKWVDSDSLPLSKTGERSVHNVENGSGYGSSKVMDGVLLPGLKTGLLPLPAPPVRCSLFCAMTILLGCGRKISHGTLSGISLVWLNIPSFQQSIGVGYVLPHLGFWIVKVLTKLILGPSWSWAALDYGSAYIIDLLIWDDEDNRVRPLVLIQNVHIEPLGPSEFCLLKGGYIEMKGRVRPLSPATVFGEKEGERIKGHHRFLCHFDVDHLRTVIPDGSLFCLPLLVRLQEYDGHLATIAECLLLQHASPDKQGYTRVGLLKVSLTLAYALPEELRWIVEFAESELPLENEAIVTLY